MWTKWIIPIFGSRIIHVFAFILYYMHVSIKFYFFKIKWCFSCWNHSGYCTCDSMNSLVTRRSPWMFPSPHYLLGLGFDFLRGVFLALPAKWGLYSITQHTIARLAGSGSSSQFFIALLKAVQIGDSEGIINSQGRAHLLSCFIPLSPHCPVRGLSHSRFSWWRDSHGLFIQYSFPFSALLLILAHPPSLPLTSLSAGLGRVQVGLNFWSSCYWVSGLGITSTHHFTCCLFSSCVSPLVEILLSITESDIFLTFFVVGSASGRI